MIEPLSLAFDVRCSVDHAFHVWTSRISTWWPADHSVSGEPERVVLEGSVGGRIFERTADGLEHDWGTVTVWEPPTRLGYRWHLSREPEDATDVDIRFHPTGDSVTRVEIVHGGWDRIANGQDWRERNEIGWQSLVPHFVTHIEEENADGSWNQGGPLGPQDTTGDVGVHDVPRR